MAKVLIIEDNENNLYLETFILEKYGHQVIQAMSGEEGISRAMAEQPDLILLDIQLPEMDGYEVARSIRRLETLRTTPIIAVTSYAMVGDRENILSAGCNDYIEKPINPDVFIDQVSSHFTKQR